MVKRLKLKYLIRYVMFDFENLNLLSKLNTALF